MRNESNPISASVELRSKHESDAGDYYEFEVRTVDVAPGANHSSVSQETVYARIVGWKSQDDVPHLRVYGGFLVSDIFGFTAPLIISGEGAPGAGIEANNLEVYLTNVRANAADGTRRYFALASMARFLHTELLGFRVPSPFGGGSLVLRV